MSIDKKTFLNRPIVEGNGTYNYLNNDSNQYTDSDGLPINFDKFAGKDLYTYSVGDDINEAILESRILDLGSVNQGTRPWLGANNRHSLQPLGDSYITINSINIKNRGVRSRINDVYFHLYLFSKEFFNPFESNGDFRSYTDLVSGFRQSGNIARFFSQKGPNFGKGGSPGTSLFSNITIARNFITEDHGPSPGDNSIVTVPENFHPQQFDGFNPSSSLPKDTTTPYPADEHTTIFQQDGVNNPIYIGVHMDGDQDTFFDRSRNETIAVYEIDTSVLLDLDQTPPGKLQTLSFSKPTAQRHSRNQSRAAAFRAEELSVTIDTTGGASLVGGYNPPAEFKKYINDIEPNIKLTQKNINNLQTNITEPEYLENINEFILQMDPKREIKTLPHEYNLSTLNGYSDSEQGQVEANESEIVLQYMLGKFGQWLPISKVGIHKSSLDIDFQTYYENKNDRIKASAPNNVSLGFYITPHPQPYSTNGPIAENWSVHKPIGWSLYGNNNDGIKLNPRGTVDTISYNGTYIDGNGFTQTGTFNINHTIEDEFGNILNDDGTRKMFVDSNYFFLVIDWDDKDDKYKTIGNVMDDWPRTMSQLNKKQNENLYKLSNINNQLNNNYTTSGAKIIKSIVFNTSRYESIADENGNFTLKAPDYNNIEPLRWKLVTTKIFLDIPISEYPDFSEVGGTDYTTIPWPYTTPIIGGVDKQSEYYKSIDDVLGGGKISFGDVIDESFLLEAKQNDELGKNIQKIDLEQIRFFNTGSYDLNTLLNIDIQDNSYIPYNGYKHLNTDGTIYWDGETHKLSEESSVGQIFINDNQDNDLKQNCKLELNTGNLDSVQIDDSSGGSNKGLLIGDYRIIKNEKNQPMRRDSSNKIPKKNNNSNGAL